MVTIRARVDTGAAALGQTGLAGLHARAAGADVPWAARPEAEPTMIHVGREVATDPTAVGGTGLTLGKTLLRCVGARREQQQQCQQDRRASNRFLHGR